jgi:hypothetical protein
LDGKVGQDRHRKIFFSEALFDQLQSRHGIVRGKADFGDEKDEEKRSYT